MYLQLNCGIDFKDGLSKVRIPAIIQRKAIEASIAARQQCSELPSLHPDVVVINKYDKSSKLNLHKDKVSELYRDVVKMMSINFNCCILFRSPFKMKEYL